MKRFLAIFFTFLYFLAMCRPITPLVTYLVYQDYIIEYLCINKDKPKMECNGKCYLSKQIKKQEEKRKNAPRIQLEDYPIGFITLLRFKAKTFVSARKAYFSKADNYTYKPLFEFFHPPTFSLHI